MKIGFDAIVKTSITSEDSIMTDLNEFTSIARDETAHAKFANAMYLKEAEGQKFWSSSVVQHYLLDIIEEHYPESQSPYWVDRKRFLFYMKKKFFRVLWEVLEDDFADGIEDHRRSVFYLTEHLFAYISDQIDVDDFERKLEDYREIEISDEIWDEYFKVKGKPMEEDSDNEEPEENPIPISRTKVEMKVEKKKIDAENIARRLEEMYPPKWYILEKDIVRDDVYEGMKRLFPKELENVGWGDFWEALSPFICDWSGPMYIRLKDLWKSPTPYVAVVTNLSFVISPSQLTEWFIGKVDIEEIRRYPGYVRLYLKNEESWDLVLHFFNGREMDGRIIRTQKWEDFTIHRDDDCYLGGNVWGV